MKPKRSAERRALWSRPKAAWLLCVAILLVGVSLLVRRVDHDESQYVAAIALMRSGMPYRDFAYLQTPLQPLLLSPFAYLPAGWAFIAARIASGLFGFLTILLLYGALEARASRRAIIISLASLLCTDAFLLASSLARNDALAMVLVAAALPPLLAGLETRSGARLALAGLFLGLAASTKISAALPAACAVLFLLFHVRKFGPRAVACSAIGLAVGLVPTLMLAAAAPGEFRFDVFSYNFDAPVQWWASIGQGSELDPLRRGVKLVGLAMVGSVLTALIATAVDRRSNDERRILDLMIVGGLVAAYLPKPALTQYLVPLLPPLFVRFALAFDAAGEGWRRALTILVALGSIAGLASSFVLRSSDFELIRTIGLGRELAALAGQGSVATLSPEYVAGIGVSLDPRLAAGPFLYRTRGLLARAAERDGRAISIDSLDQSLDSSRPSVILVGREKQPFKPDFPAGLDQPLVRWAQSRGYRRKPLGEGFDAFINPSSGAMRKAHSQDR